MERVALDAMAQAEERHWWFVGRRRIVRHALERLHLPPSARLLEAGCGAGGNLPLLAEFGEVSALELDAPLRARAESRGIGRVRAGALPADFPFDGEKFDVVLLLDVLEHLPEPEASLRVLRSALVPGGRLVVTVPAYQWLWSAHDELHHHKQRYTISLLERQLRAAGLTLVVSSHFNTALFPVAATVRLLSRVGWLEQAMTAFDLPAGNALLGGLFGQERHLAVRGLLPFGLSILGVAVNA